jgi:hypothetical protein
MLNAATNDISGPDFIPGDNIVSKTLRRIRHGRRVPVGLY